MKNEHPYGARRECRRQALRNPRGTTANCAARRERESPIGPPCGAHREQQRRALRKPRGTAGVRKFDRPTLRRTARMKKASPPQPSRHGGSAKVRSAHPAAHIGNSKGGPSATLAAQPQPPRHGGSVAGSRGAHADGGTRHRASSRRWHRAISLWRGVGSRGATVGRPSAHCASPGRHSGPRSSPPDRAPPRAHPPQPKA